MRKILKGIIVSNKMLKTVVVAVTNYKKFPKYQKFYKSRKKYKAHVESGDYHIGDMVYIEQCRPMSKEKKWRVVGQVEIDKSGFKGENKNN